MPKDSGSEPAGGGQRRRAWHPCARAGLVAAALFAGVGSVGADLTQAGLVALAVALAMCLEALASRREARALLQIHSRAANHEGQRTAAAQILALELALERSRSVLEALGEGVVVVDAGGEVVMANPTARAAMQERERGPEGRLLWEALHPGLAALAQRAIEVLQAAPDGAGTTVRHLGIACGARCYDFAAVPARSSRTGQHFGFVFLFVDSTRAHELQRLKDRFLSSVSHELRTPLTNLCAFAEILGTMLPGESMEWPEFVRVIHDESVRLSRLVDAMFDYLQLESGEAVLRREEVDAAKVARDVAAEFAAAAVGCGVDLRVAREPGVAAVLADERRLRFMLTHLVENALKFTPAGGTVRVDIVACDGAWEVRVADSGRGVPATERDAVFEKFHQLPDHLTDKPTGTGLGLATCRAIATCLQGSIWCEDSPLGGAQFVVRLPAAPTAGVRPVALLPLDAAPVDGLLGAALATEALMAPAAAPAGSNPAGSPPVGSLPA